MSERYPHVLSGFGPTCEHCRHQERFLSRDDECPVRLRQALDRLILADREFFRWTASGPNGCPPYASHFGTALGRLDESFAALRGVEDYLRDEIARLTAELHAAQAVIAADDALIGLKAGDTCDPRAASAWAARVLHVAAHKARQGEP